MDGIKNGAALVGRKLNNYAGEALNSIYKKTVDPLLDKIASINFANSYFSNSAILESQKFSAFRRNVLGNEDAFLGIGEYPTGEKHDGGLKEILVLIGLLTAAGGGIAIAKKYDIGLDDISATIAYLEGKTFGTPSEITAIADSHTLAPTPAPTVAAANATVKETPAPHEFTPDIKVFGSEAFKTKVQTSLDELNKTPDSFRIDGMTAYEYATYYIDELYEGDRENYIDIGKEQYPINLIFPSNLIHIPRHIQQGQNQTFLANMKKWDEKGEDGSLLMEYDAIKLQVSWEKARYNLTDEIARNRFNYYMKQYTNDSKYFEDNLSVN